MINFSKPVVFFDLETTELDKNKAKIVEISMIKVGGYGVEIARLNTLVNPEMRITNSDIHGITNEMVLDAPFFKDIAEKVHAFIEDCIIAGFNNEHFDNAILARELMMCGFAISASEMAKKSLDINNIYKRLNPRTLRAAYSEYTGNEIQNAHRAEADAEATMEVFYGMVNKHSKDIGADVSDWAAYSLNNKNAVDYDRKFVKNDAGEICINFGKLKNKLAKDNIGLMQWILKNPFESGTKQIAQDIIDGKI